MFHESSFTNVGRRCETPRSEPKGFITNNAARSMSFKFLSVPLASKAPWGQHKGSKSCCTCSRFVLHVRNPAFRDVQSFIRV